MMVLMSNCRLPGLTRYIVFDILSKIAECCSVFRSLIIEFDKLLMRAKVTAAGPDSAFDKDNFLKPEIL